MKRQIVLSPLTLALAVGLVLAALVIAVLATLMLTGGGEASIPVQAGPSSASPTMPAAAAAASPSIRLAEVTATEEVQPTPTSAPTEPIEPTPTPVAVMVQATAMQPTSAPTPAPTTEVPRYGSVDARPYWDAFIVAFDALGQTGVETYQEALASPTWYGLAQEAEGALWAMQDFFYYELPYDDACTTALNIVGQRSHFFYGGLREAVKPLFSPAAGSPGGQDLWNGTVEYHQPRFNEAMAAARAACAY